MTPRSSFFAVLLALTHGCGARSAAPPARADAAAVSEISGSVPDPTRSGTPVATVTIAPPELPAASAPPDEKADKLAAWLTGHPEILTIEIGPLDDDCRCHTTQYQTATESVRCLHLTPDAPGDRRSWCWSSERAVLQSVVLHMQFRQARGDTPASIVMFERVTDSEGAIEVRALRFPQGEWTQVPSTSPTGYVVDRRRPNWYPLDSSKIAKIGAAWRVPSGPWTPLAPASSRFDLGELSGVAVRPVIADTPGLAMLEFTAHDFETMAGIRFVCTRWNERWACAPRQKVDPTYVTDEYNFAYVLTAQDRDLVAMQRSTLEDGGNGELSGAAGQAWLELASANENTLLPLGSLQIGGMEWLTLRRGGRNGSFVRWTKRFYHPHSRRGRGCIAFAATEYEQAETDADFYTKRRMKRRLEMFARQPVLDVLVAHHGVFDLPEDEELLNLEGNEAEVMGAAMQSWVLTGLWAVGSEGQLTRISSDPASQCPA